MTASALQVDLSDFLDAVKDAKVTKYDMAQIAGAGQKMIINNQRMLVPVDTSATKNSIREYVVRITKSEAEIDVGPDTIYAPNIEYGRRDMPNYPVQPFIRPSVRGRLGQHVQNVIKAAFKKVLSKWP